MTVVIGEEDDDEEEEEDYLQIKTVAFDPQEHDVVSTKLRSWNLRHPGNLAYADLLAEYASKLPSTTDPNYSSILSEITQALIKLITEEKGGRFLKIQGGENHPNDCTVMNYKEAHHKVLQALKNIPGYAIPLALTLNNCVPQLKWQKSTQTL